MHPVRAILILFLLGIIQTAQAQYGRQLTPIYVDGTSYQNKGWFVSPGITYMLPEDRNEKRTEYMQRQDQLDTLYDGNFKRKGRVGLYLEVGRHHFLTASPIINHLDYGIHFKMLRGRENFEGTTFLPPTPTPVVDQSLFSESFAGGFFNASNIWQVTDHHWIQNSIGLNAEYRVISKRQMEVPFGASHTFPNAFIAQAHYKLGFGWRPEPGIYILTMLETPIITAYPWENGKSTLPYFTGRYRPLILTLRIAWLSKAKERSCENQPGKNAPNLDKKRRKKTSNSLFGDDAKRMKGIKE